MKIYLIFSREYDAEGNLWDVFNYTAFTSKQSAQEYCDKENEFTSNPDTKCFVDEVEVDE